MSRPNHDTQDTQDAERFDQAMQTLHTQALEQTSPSTRQKLRNARTTSARARPTHRGLSWAGAAVATVFALAIGLNFRSGSLPTPVTSPVGEIVTAAAPPTATATDDDSDSYESAVTALDENPDLYVWLASNDDALQGSQ